MPYMLGHLKHLVRGKPEHLTKALSETPRTPQTHRLSENKNTHGSPRAGSPRAGSPPRYVGGCDAVALIVRNDFHPAILVDAHAAWGGFCLGFPDGPTDGFQGHMTEAPDSDTVCVRVLSFFFYLGCGSVSSRPLSE